MFDLTFLGTSASVPSADRNHPSLPVEAGGHRIMVDCGEGTQRQLLRSGAGFRRLDRLLLTHAHFDHVGGLHEFADRRVHAADAAETRDPFGMRLRREDFPDGTEEMYAYYDVPVPEVALRAVPAADFDIASWRTPGAEPTMISMPRVGFHGCAGASFEMSEMPRASVASTSE